MELKTAQKVEKELQDYYSAEIMPKLNVGSLPLGSTYGFESKESGIGRIEFGVKNFGTVSHVGATASKPSDHEWFLRIFPSEGGNPLRFEEHKPHSVHVNSVSPSINHTKFIIPAPSITTYGAIGSVVMGCYEHEKGLTAAEIIQEHFNCLEKNEWTKERIQNNPT